MRYLIVLIVLLAVVQALPVSTVEAVNSNHPRGTLTRDDLGLDTNSLLSKIFPHGRAHDLQQWATKRTTAIANHRNELDTKVRTIQAYQNKVESLDPNDPEYAQKVKGYEQGITKTRAEAAHLQVKAHYGDEYGADQEFIESQFEDPKVGQEAVTKLGWAFPWSNVLGQDPVELQKSGQPLQEVVVDGTSYTLPKSMINEYFGGAK